MKQLVFISILLIGCKKTNHNQESPKPYFMSANINGKPWNVRTVNNRFINAVFLTEYFDAEKTWHFTISADNQSQDTLCYGISISFGFVPKKGRYYFNNKLDQGALNGISAIYVFYKKMYDQYATKYSIDGFVDIEEMTKEEMKGSFNFNAKGFADDSTTTSLTQGAFYVYNGGGAGLPWPGP